MDQTRTSGSDEREARPLDDPLMSFDLSDDVERLRGESGYADFGRSSVTLGKSDHVRMVLTALRKGEGLGNEHTDAAIAMEVLDGEVRVGRGGTGPTFSAGNAVWIGEGGPWEVSATEDAALLLTLGWGGPASGDDDVR